MLIKFLKAAVFGYLAYYTKAVTALSITALQWYNKLYLALIALVVLSVIEGIIKSVRKYQRGK